VGSHLRAAPEPDRPLIGFGKGLPVDDVVVHLPSFPSAGKASGMDLIVTSCLPRFKRT
jgi:hypothetical protein